MIATIFVYHESNNDFMKSEMSEDSIYQVGDIVVINNRSYNVSKVITDKYPDYSSITQYIELVIAKEFEDVAGSI